MSATYTFEIDDDLAGMIAVLPADRRKKLDLLLRLRVRDVLTYPPRPLSEVLDELGRKAAANGLTPEELKSILNEPHVPGGPRYEHPGQREPDSPVGSTPGG